MTVVISLFRFLIPPIHNIFSPMNNNLSKLTLSANAGLRYDTRYKGIVNPIFVSSAYDYEEVDATRYPRYFNTPNQQIVEQQLALLEHAEAAVLFSSGMAAISTGLFSVLRKGDHAVIQNDLYGGTYEAIVSEFRRFDIDCTFVDGVHAENFEKAIRPNTKIVYIESPSNPTLKITDIRSVADTCKKHGILSMIDNTFASPINQNPITLGIDIVAHSGTKYLGGHSDLCCGVVLSTKNMCDGIRHSALHFGGSLNGLSVYLLERSLKTLALRVRQQNNNAMAIAAYLSEHAAVSRVHYPGLKDHPGHALAAKQMPGGFGGMLSFEVRGDAPTFIEKLQIIRRAVSLGGVESTICIPAKTSHIKMTAEERRHIGVADQLVRLSVGVEDRDDLIGDIDQALALT